MPGPPTPAPTTPTRSRCPTTPRCSPAGPCCSRTACRRESSTAGRSTTCRSSAPRSTTPAIRAAKYIASTFDVVHDAGLSTALYASKDKFIIYDQSYNETTGAANPHGRDKIDVYFFQDDGPPTNSDGMNRRFLADMAAKHFNYSFVHYRDTDSAGHAFGWGSPEYLQAVANVDGYLADVLHLVETDPKLKATRRSSSTPTTAASTPITAKPSGP